MKIFLAALVLIAGFTACGKIEQLTNLAQQKIETENAETDQPDVPPVLEITQDEKGMSAVTGKTLFFNLYDNGIIEFEYADERKKTPGKLSRAEEINTLVRAKISREELQKFTDLLKTEDFRKTADNYKRKCCCTDATVDYKISAADSSKQKTININAYCGLGELTNPQMRDKSDFPKVLSDLLSLAENTRARYILEKSSNQSQ
jgi:hypothetical protein